MKTNETHRTLQSVGIRTLHGRMIPAPALTKRQAAVAVLIRSGHSAKEVARELGISENTVETHCEAIRDRILSAFPTIKRAAPRYVILRWYALVESAAFTHEQEQVA